MTLSWNMSLWTIISVRGTKTPELFLGDVQLIVKNQQSCVRLFSSLSRNPLANFNLLSCVTCQKSARTSAGSLHWLVSNYWASNIMEIPVRAHLYNWSTCKGNAHAVIPQSDILSVLRSWNPFGFSDIPYRLLEMNLRQPSWTWGQSWVQSS